MHFVFLLMEGADNYEECLDRIQEINGGSQFNDTGHSAGFDSTIIDFMRNKIDKFTHYTGYQFVMNALICQPDPYL